MEKQPQQQLVRIATGTGKAPLTKNQKAFNGLTAHIADQEKRIAELRAAIDAGRRRIQTELTPLHQKLDALRADMVRLFDQMNTRHTFAKSDRKKLTHLIVELSYELIQQGHDELTEIHDRYHEGGFEAAMAEAEESSAASLQQMAQTMFGIEFDPNGDFTDPEKVRAYIGEQLRQRAEADQQREEEAAQRRIKKPKTEKHRVREAKKQAEEQKTTKAVRALYMDLVKAFHPDREPDEAEKIRKTTIMQRVTAAYEKGDLMALFRLQLEFERIDQAHLEKLADVQLQYYNRILKQQADELDGELLQVENELRSMTGGGLSGVSSAQGLDYAISNDVKSMKSATKDLKADLKVLTNPAALKAWLKSYRIPG